MKAKFLITLIFFVSGSALAQHLPRPEMQLPTMTHNAPSTNSASSQAVGSTTYASPPAPVGTENVVNGFMIINERAEMVHPAEFIELTFTQQVINCVDCD